MGIYDREYYQEDETRGSFSFQSIARWPWSFRLIGLYVVLFFVDHLIPGGDGRLGSAGPLSQWGFFSTNLCFQQGQIWRLFTHMFIEPDPQALLFGMITIYFFGPMIENTLGRGMFLAYYIATGVGGALIASLAAPLLLNREAFQSGPFGPIMGLVIAAGVFHAQRTVMFMFIVPMTMQTLAILSVVVDAAFMVSGVTPAVGILGSALTGYVLIQTRALQMVGQRLGRTSRARGGWVNPPSVIKLPNIGAAFTPKPVSEDELDRLLAKVHEHGIGSLSNTEKAILKRASKQKRQR